MPWVYLDDAFYDHPKIIAAGPAAGWLWVVALGWTNRNLTAGVIPKHVARRLVEGGRRLAPLLVKAGLWEDHDDSYRFHDYEQWNKTAAKREQAQKAARARWNHADAHAPAYADASAGAMPEHMPNGSGSNANGHADALPEQCPSNAPRAYAHGEAPKPLALSPKTILSSVVELDPGPDKHAEEDEEGSKGLNVKIGQAARIVAAHRLAANPTVIRNRPAWLRTTEASIRTVLEAEELAPTVTVDQLIALAEPSHPLAAVQVEPVARSEQRRTRQRAAWEACQRGCDHGWLPDDDNEHVSRCPCQEGL